MAMQTRIAEHQPILELNTTPLIDVMLVLLIMFIITIPIQSHAVKVDLPAACTDCPKPNSFKNEIEITRVGALLWNEQPISRDGLKYERWEKMLLKKVEGRAFAAVGLHDCYAPFWLPHYRGLLERLQGLGRLATMNQVAAEVTLANAA